MKACNKLGWHPVTYAPCRSLWHKHLWQWLIWHRFGESDYGCGCRMANLNPWRRTDAPL